MSDSVRPHRLQPTRLPYPWDSPGKNTGVGCHFLLQCMKVKSESEVTQSCPTPRPWKTPIYSLLLEKAMAPHSSTFAWKISWTEEPGRLQSMGSLESGTTERLHFHFSLSTFMHWRWKWQPTPVFLSGESQGWGALVGCHLWGRTESDMTEAT